MGRYKKKFEDKKSVVSLRVPINLVPFLEKMENKSKFVENLLINYFKKNK